MTISATSGNHAHGACDANKLKLHEKPMDGAAGAFMAHNKGHYGDPNVSGVFTAKHV